MVSKMHSSERFWSASLAELKRGYREDAAVYQCLLCGNRTDKGIVYPHEGLLYTPEKMMQTHIQKKHGSVFDYLLGLDKKITGLSEHQKTLLQLFFQGKSNAEIQNEMGIGSLSTIRNHRFALKEKARQAKLLLVIMELLQEREQRGFADLAFSSDSERPKTLAIGPYQLTEEEIAKIINKCFPQGPAGPLKTFDLKQKSRLVVLWEIAKRFEAHRIYSEKEVNEALKHVYAADYATIRRQLIEYGFMDRTPDGREYWLKDTNSAGGQTGKEEADMERKKELKQLYKEMKTEGGVYLIRNTRNQKVLVVSTPNLKTINGRKMQLRDGTHQNRQLQEELRHYGPDAFVFEVLEVLEEKADASFNKAEALKQLEQKWLEKLQPYGERGYNQLKDGDH